MAVTQQVPRNVSTAAPGATEFAFDFKVVSKTDMQVQVDGVAKVVDVDYTIAGVGNDAGGTITLLTPLAGGETVLRRRNMAFQRTADYQNLGDLRSPTLNNDQDAPVMMIQQVAENVARALQLPVDSVFSAQLPPPIPLRPLVVNAAGTAYENGDTTLTGDMLLRPELASAGAGKGADLVAFDDPVAPTFLKTTSDILNGERVSVLRGIAKTEHAAIRAGTSTTDVSATIQALIDNMLAAGRGHLYLPEGRYTAKLLTVGSNTTIEGTGRSIITSPITGGQYLLSNKNLGSFTDQNIVVKGVVFDSQGVGMYHPVTSPLPIRNGTQLFFSRVTGVTVRDCLFRNDSYSAIQFSGVRNILLDGNTATNIGWAGPIADSGGFVFYFINESGGEQCREIIARNNTFRNNWTCAFVLAAEHAEISGNTFRSVVGTQIFAPYVEAAGQPKCTHLRIIGNSFYDIQEAPGSSSAIEFGARNVVVANNIFDECGDHGMAMTSARHVVISNNVIRGFGRTIANEGAGIGIYTDTGTITRDILIHGNRIADGAGTGHAAVAFRSLAGGPAPEDVRILDNNFSDWTPTSGQMLYLDSGMWGSGCRHKNNAGLNDTHNRATAYRTAVQSVANATTAAVSWQAADDNPTGIWNVANPTRLTVPATARKVRLSGQVSFAANATGDRRVFIFKNGAAMSRAVTVIHNAVAGGVATTVVLPSIVVDVVPGDYFTAEAFQNSGGALDVQFATTFFTMEVLE